MPRAVLVLWLLSVPLFSQQPKKPFDVWALHRLARISDPQLSPDGSTVAFVVTKAYISDNAKEKHIYTISVDGGSEQRITFGGKQNERPRWSPGSNQIAFISDRSGSSQVWLMDSDGSRARQVTDLATEAAGVLFSGDGEHLLFTSRVFPECGAVNACNAEKLRVQEEGPIKAQIFDRLLYRHWDTWNDGRRTHLLVAGIDGDEVRDLTPGPYDVPPFSLGGPDGYDVSPDGFEVCFTMAATRSPATETNSEIYVVPIEGGEPVMITSNPAVDTSPLYSPNGRYIAYRAQSRPNYESDRFTLMVYDRTTGDTANVTETSDRWVTSIAWSPDSSRLFFTAEDRGREPIYTVPAAGGGIRPVVFGDATHGDVQLTPDGKSIIYSGHSGSHPTEIFRGFSTGGRPHQLTHLNDEILAEHQITPLEQISYEAGDGTQIHGFVVKPPGFDYEKKYPLLLLVHGGPQGAWGESWSYRWNAQVFAGAGFVVFMPNPRGSTGYGQAFIDAINGDWGGMVYDDIMAGVDYFLKQPYVDNQKLVAAGASYGGYMVNWMLGHTSRFRALVSHAGVFDLRSMFGSTEELWFPLWEFSGPPWDNPEMYARWSPSNFVQNFKTPTLVVHGKNDYRVPVSQAMQLFSALQLRDVPSRFLYFPDEGHWILKPRNSVHWYETVIDWLQQWMNTAYRHRSRPRKYGPTVDPPETESSATRGKIKIQR